MSIETAEGGDIKNERFMEKSGKKTHNILRQRKTATEYCELRSWINRISDFDYLKNPDLNLGTEEVV